MYVKWGERERSGKSVGGFIVYTPHLLSHSCVPGDNSWGSYCYLLKIIT